MKFSSDLQSVDPNQSGFTLILTSLVLPLILTSLVLPLILTSLVLPLTVQQSINVSGDVTQNPATISQWSVTSTGLVDILCTDVTSGVDVSCTCSVKYTNPLGGPFEVKKNFNDKCKVLFVVLGWRLCRS